MPPVVDTYAGSVVISTGRTERPGPAAEFALPAAVQPVRDARRVEHAPGDEVHEVLQTLLLAVMKHKTWSGTFFITSDGHLGIGPESTQPGDQIVVLDGARSPFVLRNLEDSTDYALLGGSFVLGLMHGEVREMDARGQLESRQIVIR